MEIICSRVCKSTLPGSYWCWLQLLMLACVVAVRGIQFQVVENSPTNFVVGSVHNQSLVSTNYRFTGSTSVPCSSHFEINAVTSVISVLNQSQLDREAIVRSMGSDILRCFVAFDVTTNSAITTDRSPVTVEILDVNDRDPYFYNVGNPHFVNISENVAIPTPIWVLQPVDEDKGDNGTTHFNITNGNEDGYFLIDVPEGATAESTTNRVLLLKRTLDFEALSNGGVFNLTITISDMGLEPRITHQVIIISVLNLVDEPPTFEITSYRFNVTENHPVGDQDEFVFGRVRAASDLSIGQILYNVCTSCHKLPSNVTSIIGVNRFTGGLYLKAPLDFENLQPQLSMFQFEISATNLNTRETETTAITVDVIDVNEESPYFVCFKNHIDSICEEGVNLNNRELRISEGFSETKLFEFSFDDDDPRFKFREINRTSIGHHVQPEENHFTFVLKSIEERFFILLMKLNTALDRETTQDFVLTLTVENLVQPTLRSNTIIRIRVLDINDNAPNFTREYYEGYVYEGSPIGTEIITVQAHDPDEGENGTITYSMSVVNNEAARSWFHISPESGVVSVSDRSINYLSVDGYVVLNVTASDNGSEPLSSSVIVHLRILPSATFLPGSYLEFSSTGFNLLAGTETVSSFYLEFRTSDRNGLLAYQQNATGGVFAVEVQDGGIAVRLGSSEVLEYRDADISTDTWHAVYIQQSANSQMNLMVMEIESTNSRLTNFQDLTTQRCVNISEEDLNHHSSLYIGGVNLFLLASSSNLQTTNFVGGIRNVAVGGEFLDLSCPAAGVNTITGVVRSHGCAEMSCSSSRSAQCVDYAEESYCQCLGGFSSQTCRITENSQEIDSYSPIRFRGNTQVSLNLGYTFFYHLEQGRNQNNVPGGNDAGPGAGTGVGPIDGEGLPPGKRRNERESGKKRRDISVADSPVQEVEVRFRMVILRSTALLFSQTSSSVHLIAIEHDNERGTSLKYTVWSYQNQLTSPVIDMSITDFPFETQTEYHLVAATSADTVSLSISDRHLEQRWGNHSVTPFAEQPQTAISIGGASLSPPNMDNLSYFMGCISYISIDGIELPLNGLLTADTENGGFAVEDKDGVENFCNLCDLTICPEQSDCLPDNFGNVSCDCRGNLTLATNGRSCIVPTVETVGQETSSAQSSLVSYIGGGAGAAVLVLIGIVIIVIIVVVRRRQEKQKSTYQITSMPNGHMSNGLSNGHSRSKPENQYTPTIPKRRPSLTSSMNPNCNDSHERASSASAYQEPDRHSSLRKSAETTLKIEADQEARGIPQMDDSGHEVNSTDSAHSMESEDIASSSCNEQPSSSSHPPILRITGGGMPNSPDQYSHRKPLTPITPRTPLTPRTPRTPLTPRIPIAPPHTPLTPKEQKIMIPLRPDSTNLSQSEYGDEAETGSFNTRVSSSSGAGGSMQNQGRGSDSENSKISGCSTPQWYKSSTNSDTEREIERIQSTVPFYPVHLSHPERGGRASNISYQPRFKQGAAAHPPTYHSPPTFSEHMTRGHSRPKSKSMHGNNTQSPLANTPRKYENYPHSFTSNGNGLRKGQLVYEQHRPNGSYGSSPRHESGNYGSSPRHESGNYGSSPHHERQLSDPRVLDEEEEEEEAGSYTTAASFSRQYSDPRIPRSGNYCIPRKHTDPPQPVHSRQLSDPRQSSQQTQEYVMAPPRSSHSMRHITSPSAYSNKRQTHSASSSNNNSSRLQDQRPYYQHMIPDHVHYTANQPGRSFSSGDTGQAEEPFQTLKSLSKIDPISNWDAQDRMKIAVDHIDLLSGPCIQFEDVSTDPSVIESQLTIDESMMGDQQVFESQGGGEGTADMLDPLDLRLVRLREDEIDSILTDSEFGQHEMNHFPTADCSSQYTATIVAGSTSTSGESTPKLQRVFIIPPSQQSFDV